MSRMARSNSGLDTITKGKKIEIIQLKSSGKQTHTFIPPNPSSMITISNIVGIKESGSYTVTVYPQDRSQPPWQVLITVPSIKPLSA